MQTNADLSAYLKATPKWRQTIVAMIAVKLLKMRDFDNVYAGLQQVGLTVERAKRFKSLVPRQGLQRTFTDDETRELIRDAFNLAHSQRGTKPIRHPWKGAV